MSAHVEGGGPLKQGSKLKLTRRMGPREQNFTTEITEFDPPHTYAFRGIDGPIRPIARGRVEPLDGGERSRFSFDIEFEGKGIGKLLLPLVRRQARKQLPEAHDRLKEQLEGPADVPISAREGGVG